MFLNSYKSLIKCVTVVILSVVLYGCETWSLILREERRLRVFQNRMLRRIFGPKKDEVTGEWRRLHNKEFHALCFAPNIIRVIKSGRRMCGEYRTYGESKCAYRVSVGETLGNDTIWKSQT